MTRYYVGLDGESGKSEVFEWDERKEPTSVVTGYDTITGPFENKTAANDFLNDEDDD